MSGSSARGTDARQPRQARQPFVPARDFDEPCEDCGAPAGAYDFPDCPSGYTAEDARAEAERSADR
ncbi:hypothetical protein [Streptomyces sp. NRRL S-350]|uniref:hypothetical protein n=1 Tax=Streptomyces sp. NRRL S-350 TaxID=1463902 RepID=UPI00056760F0|nr:hypothetical protein [Streptomyces sp. NRRL S-350]